MPSQDEQDYKDYQDYLEYQKHVAAPAAPEPADAQRGPALERPPPSTAMAGAAGVSQGLTAGNTPQLVGAGATLGGKLQDLIMGKVIDPRTGQPIPRVNYTDARDATIKNIDDAKNAHPIAYGTGVVAGSMAPGMGAAKMTKGLGFVKGGAAAGAGIGALTNPGDEKGVVHNPLEGDFQAGSRTVNAGTGMAMGAAFGGLSKLIGTGAKVSSDIKDIKSGAMADRAKSALDDAGNAIDDQLIEPADAKLRELVSGKQYEINPERVKPTFSKLGAAMERKIPTEEVPFQVSNDAGTFPATKQAPTEARVPISGSRALKLKRAADSVANYGSSKPFDPTATAKGEEAKSLADILRSQINADPEALAANESMANNMALKTALLKNEGSTPIETLQAPFGSSKQQVLAKIDNSVGTKLQDFGKEISTAKHLQLKPGNLLKPLELPNELKKIVLRGGAEASAVLNKLPSSTKESLINALTPTRTSK